MSTGRGEEEPKEGALAEEVEAEGSEGKVDVRGSCGCPVGPDVPTEEGNRSIGQLMAVHSHNTGSLR